MFCLFSCENIDINSEKCIEMASSDSQIDNPEHGFPKRAELQDINTCINTGAQSINTERASLQSNLVSNQKKSRTPPPPLPQVGLLFYSFHACRYRHG